jgi:hypothetical protein
MLLIPTALIWKWSMWQLIWKVDVSQGWFLPENEGFLRQPGIELRPPVS